MNDTVLEGANPDGGSQGIFQGSNEELRSPPYHAFSSTSYFSLGTGSKGQLCPGATGQMLDLMPWGARGRGEDPTRPLQLVAEIEASTPRRCSIWERSPGPWTHNQQGRNEPRGRAGRAAAWAHLHVSPDPRRTGRLPQPGLTHSFSISGK